MDCPVWQAGMDHDVDCPAIVPKLKPATSLLDVCQRTVRLWNPISHVFKSKKNPTHRDVLEFNV